MSSLRNRILVYIWPLTASLCSDPYLLPLLCSTLLLRKLTVLNRLLFTLCFWLGFWAATRGRDWIRPSKELLSSSRLGSETWSLCSIILVANLLFVSAIDLGGFEEGSFKWGRRGRRFGGAGGTLELSVWKFGFNWLLRILTRSAKGSILFRASNLMFTGSPYLSYCRLELVNWLTISESSFESSFSCL